MSRFLQPAVRLMRTSTSPAGRVVEIYDSRMRADQYAIGYPLHRDADANPTRNLP